MDCVTVITWDYCLQYTFSKGWESLSSPPSLSFHFLGLRPLSLFPVLPPASSPVIHLTRHNITEIYFTKDSYLT